MFVGAVGRNAYWRCGIGLLCTFKRSLLVPAASSESAIFVNKVREILANKVGSPNFFGAEQDASVALAPLVGSQHELPAKRMLDSYREAAIPLGSQPYYRTQFINQQKTVRIGKILESLDTMAVWIGYTHNDDVNHTEKKSPISIVTAFVDSIGLRGNSIVADADILIRGHVTWAGATSMEITMHVDQFSSESSKYENMLIASFLMVARDPIRKCKAFVNPLQLETTEEQDIFARGEGRKAERQLQASESLLKHPPTAAEGDLVYRLFQQQIDNRHGSFKRAIKPDGCVWMEDTKLKNIFLAFPEQRNLYGKIFGGFLMRVAFELGWINAFTHCGGRRVYVTKMDDIMFRKPVEIGSLVYLSSQVVYTEGQQLQVKVHAEVVDPKVQVHETTNEFHFTFAAGYDVPPVTPRSYAEYMMYLEGRRHFLAKD